MDLLLGRTAGGPSDGNREEVLGVPPFDVDRTLVLPEEFRRGTLLSDLSHFDPEAGGPGALSGHRTSRDNAEGTHAFSAFFVPTAGLDGRRSEPLDFGTFGHGFEWPQDAKTDAAPEISRSLLLDEPSALAIDAVPVPEPGTLVLLGFGLAGLASRLRSRATR